MIHCQIFVGLISHLRVLDGSPSGDFSLTIYSCYKELGQGNELGSTCFLNLWSLLRRQHTLCQRFIRGNKFQCLQGWQLPYNRCTWSRTCTIILAYLTYVGKYQITSGVIPFTFATSAKTNIEDSFKKSHDLTLRLYFKSILFEEIVKFFFRVTFNIIINYIFPGNFNEITTSSIFTIFVNFWIFLTLLLKN